MIHGDIKIEMIFVVFLKCRAGWLLRLITWDYLILIISQEFIIKIIFLSVFPVWKIFLKIWFFMLMCFILPGAIKFCNKFIREFTNYTIVVIGKISAIFRHTILWGNVLYPRLYPSPYFTGYACKMNILFESNF